jgi:transposase
MSREAQEYLDLQRRLATFRYAKTWGNVAKACRTFAVPRASYYRWKKAYDAEGEAGLARRRPIAKKHPKAIGQETVNKVLNLRTKYHLGPQRIVWYMERYHGIRIAFSSVYRILVRHGVSRFSNRVGCRALHTRRYAKHVPGHHVQMDVKILSLTADDGKKIRRFQYTAVDDATRIRALKIYQRHRLYRLRAGEVPVPHPDDQD